MGTHVTGEIGTTGEKLTRKLTTPVADVRWAVRKEHTDGCESNTCDICAAMRKRFPFVAAWALIRATECPLLGAVLTAHNVSLYPWPENFDAWRDYHRSKPVCVECEARIYQVGPCGNCGCSETVKKSD